ncbi:MAG: PDZ domain-containing protein, partial [Bacteroidales bacterium]
MNHHLYEEDNNSRNNRFQTFLFIIIAFLLGISVTLFLLPSRKKGLSNAQVEKFNEVMEYINNYYVDTVDSDQLFEEAINSMLQSLDPHSTYANAVDNKSMIESLEGAFEGVGIQFNIMNDTVMVVGTVTGGPSEKVGIRAGDRIVSVDEKNIAGTGIDNEMVIKLLRGKKNTK